MKLHEYIAKELFEEYSIPTRKSVILDSKESVARDIEKNDLQYPIVLKAQIQVGGRGKAGGIQFANSGHEAQDIVDSMLFSELKGFKVNRIMAVEKVNIIKELYISIILDRITKRPKVIFSSVGGMDIEETAKERPEKIVCITIDPVLGVNDYSVLYLLSKSGLDLDIFSQLKPILINLFKLFTEYDCMVAEINPLAIDEHENIFALDGKVEIDDSALFRLPKIAAFCNDMADQEVTLITEAKKCGFLYIPIIEGGSVAVMSNGSGMLMNCVDLISNSGINVAAAFDLGGGATAERIKEAVCTLLKTKGLKALFVSIFGGITRCDEVAKGIKTGFEMSNSSLVLIIRMEGTNKELGKSIIRTIDGDVQIVDWLQEGVEELVKRRSLL